MSSSTSCQWVTKLISETKVHFNRMRNSFSILYSNRIFFSHDFYYEIKVGLFFFFFLVLMNTQELIFFHQQDNTLLINIDWGSYCWGSNQAPLLTRCDPRWLRSLSPLHFLICNTGMLNIGLPWWLSGKESTGNAGDAGLTVDSTH